MICVIFGELETQIRGVILFLNNILLVNIQRKLDYFFISNVLQESVKTPDVLAAFSTDYLPIMISFFSKSKGKSGKGSWNHNNSLCEESKHNNSMKKHIYTLEKLN